MKPDYYAILGVSAEATAEQIKAAYRRRALELHPDRSGQSSDAFIAVQQAYATLSDPERRRAYDRQLQQQKHTLTDRFPQTHLHWVEPFQALFAQLLGPWTELGHARWPSGAGVEQGLLEVVLSPAEARRGGCLQIELPLQRRCPGCAGWGYRSGYPCNRCLKTGTLTVRYVLQLEYPAGIADGQWLRLPLQTTGGENPYLTVCYRVSADATAL